MTRPVQTIFVLASVLLSACGSEANKAIVPVTEEPLVPFQTGPPFLPETIEAARASAPLPVLPEAFSQRKVSPDADCKAALTLRSPLRKTWSYDATLSLGDATLTTDIIDDDAELISQHSVTAFQAIPVNLDRVFSRYYGIIPSFAQASSPPSQEDEAPVQGPEYRMEYETPVVINTQQIFPGDVLSFRGLQAVTDGSRQTISKIIIDVRFDGCAEAEWKKEQLSTSIWTVRPMTLAANPYDDDPIVETEQYFFEYASSLGWFISEARSQNEIYILQPGQ